jgi:urease accessory protein
MIINHDILTLAQWLSPAFPVGAFAYSHGIETAIAEGAIRSGGDLEAWLTDIIAHGSGRNDCVLLRAAHAAGLAGGGELDAVNDTALALCASAERAMETQLQGAAFATTAAAIWGGDDRAFCYPVAVGAASAASGIDADLAAALYLQAVTSNLVSAAVRCVPLGQTAGQKVLAALTPLCAKIAQDTQGDTLEDLHSTAFASDISALRHETLQPRIFRT